MELVPGESVRHLLRQHFRLDLPQALWITRQAGQALDALHRAGFLHADVKPENIRLVKDGTVKLIDLGFAHRPGEYRELRARGYVLGTVNYLAPEVCTAASGDARSDLYSLGVTLYETLTGQLPFPPGSVTQTLERHCTQPPIDPRRHAPYLPAPVVLLLEQLLARQPADRPSSAGRVVQQLIGLELATLGHRHAAGCRMTA
jgi:serine/threonine-protein kinase